MSRKLNVGFSCLEPCGEDNEAEVVTEDGYWDLKEDVVCEKCGTVYDKDKLLKLEGMEEKISERIFEPFEYEDY